MTTVTIPFGGKPLRFEVPDANLIEVLSPHENLAVTDLDGEITRALAAPILREVHDIVGFVRP